MLAEKPEIKSLRIVFATEDGNEVMSSHASYSEQNISISFEILDRSYCAAHTEEVQSAITAFLARLNAALAECGLPLVVSK